MPNLKELKISVGKIPQLNLGEHLSGNIGLQHLHLVLVSGSGSDLHQELQSKLPPSLNRVTVEASKMPLLHPAALKVTYISKHNNNKENVVSAGKDQRKYLRERKMILQRMIRNLL